MKVVHVCQYWNENFSYQENLLPEYQKKLGHDVTVITSEYSNFSIEKKSGEYLERNYKVIRLKTFWNFKNRFVKFKGLEKKLIELKPDFIFFHGTYSPDLKIVINYKVKTNCKLVLDNHADLENSGKNIIWRKLYYEIFQKRYHKINSKNIERYFGTTPRRCEFLNKYLGINYSKIELLPIGADVDTLKKLPENLLELNNEKFISFGGKLSKEKGFKDVIDIFLNLDFPNLKLIIFGKIIDEEINEIIKKNSDKIIYMGWQNRSGTMQILKNSLFTIWPKLHTTLIEDSISVGTPVICFKNKNTDHLIGEFLESSTLKSLEKSIKLLIEDKVYYEKLKNKTLIFSKILSYYKIAEISLNVNEKNLFNYLKEEEENDK